MARSSEFNFQRKSEARSAIAGHLGTTVGAIIFYLITAMILSTVSVNIFPGSGAISTVGFMAVNFLVSLFLGLLMYGINILHLSLVYGQDVSFGGLFEGFRRGANDRIIKVQAVLTAVNFVCTLPATLYASKLTGLDGIRTHLLPLTGLYLLGSIAEIWFALGFAMCYFLIADFPEMGSAQVLRTSVKMMKGHRWRLFVLELSFLPLYFLSLLSFGIAALWVFSYEAASTASFYKWLTGRQPASH